MQKFDFLKLIGLVFEKNFKFYHKILDISNLILVGF